MFWLVASNSIIRIDPADMAISGMGKPVLPASCTVFDDAAGLRENPTATAWAAADSGGRLWFPTLGGVATIDPAEISSTPVPPKIIIRSIQKDNEDLAFDAEARLVLPAKTRRLNIDFALLSFIDPEHTLFQYKLEGFDREWSPAQTIHEATYTNLPAGMFTFSVKAVNTDGVGSDNVARLAFEKKASFFELLWVRMLAVLFLLGLGLCIGFAVVRLRIKRLHELVAQREREIALEKKSTDAERALKEREIVHNKAAGSFVPYGFLEALGKRDITEVRPGDHVEEDLAILFTDIRSFTMISEHMTSKETFDFINKYLEVAVQIITRNNGFIDKFIGDAIMGLFPHSVDDALKAVIELYASLKTINDSLKMPIQIGVGIHYGSVTLGTVGTQQRMETTVLGDSVNLASRLESATKVYGLKVLISESTFLQLKNPGLFHIREVDTVKVKGKDLPIRLYEVYDCDSPEMIELKTATARMFAEGIALYKAGSFEQAERKFLECYELNQGDELLSVYKKRCGTMIRIPPGDGWTGVSGL